MLTIQDFWNYGNRLQNFALVKLLEEKGIEVDTGLTVFNKKDWENEKANFIKRIIKRIVPYSIYKKRKLVLVKSLFDKSNKRKEAFMKFTLSYSTISEPIICKNTKKFKEVFNYNAYDYFIVGSDQVWNPRIAGNQYMFLTFVPKHKRLSFAASIGVDKIDMDNYKRYKKNFYDMKYISVREESAARLIKSISGREADVTLDPTLLLDKDIWVKTAKNPSFNLPEKFICAYFLGEEPIAVQNISNKTGIPVIRLNDATNEEVYSIGPEAFIYIIMKSELVLTDSFHAVAFSVKFNKDFYVFEREQKNMNNMFSRISDILTKFNLLSRICNRDCDALLPSISEEIWNKVNIFLKDEKERSISKLLLAMSEK